MENDVKKYLREKVMPIASEIHRQNEGTPSGDFVCALLALAGMEMSLAKDTDPDYQMAELAIRTSLQLLLEMGAQCQQPTT